MSIEPLVTFVVPCYKLAHLLSECVGSILKQDYENFEVLIMDNCSPDNTPEVAQSFKDPRVRHIRNESNLGHIRNYNRGLTLAHGKYVWLLSADDKLRSDHILSRFVSALEENPSAGFVFCRAVELHEAGEAGIAQWADHGEIDRVYNGKDFLLELIRVNSIVAPTVLMRRECLDRVGFFQVDLPFASDWYMWSILALHYDVVYLAEPMICYRIHENSLTSQYASEYARKCGGDELSVLWRIGREAELAKNPSLRDACDASFVHWAFHLMLAALKGETPCMSVEQFEEILQNRIHDMEAVQKNRAAVYARLTQSVTDLLGREMPPIAPAEELSLLWSMGLQAKAAGVASLGNTCEKVLFNRAVRYLMSPSRADKSSMTAAEFEQALQSRSQDLPSIKATCTSVYTEVADRQYSRGEYLKAKESYRLALDADPGALKTWAKYILLHTGVVGTRLRQLAN